jgi:hypothetical protein
MRRLKVKWIIYATSEKWKHRILPSGRNMHVFIRMETTPYLIQFLDYNAPTLLKQIFSKQC